MEAQASSTANDILSSPTASTNLKAVLVVDSSILEARHRDVAKKVVAYARSGGTVIFGTSNFIGWAAPDKLDAFFGKIWGISWRQSSYHSGSHTLNPSISTAERLGMAGGGLVKSFGTKATYLKGVSKEETVYFSSTAGQTAVAFSKVSPTSSLFASSCLPFPPSPSIHAETDRASLSLIPSTDKAT